MIATYLSKIIVLLISLVSKDTLSDVEIFSEIDYFFKEIYNFYNNSAKRLESLVLASKLKSGITNPKCIV